MSISTDESAHPIQTTVPSVTAVEDPSFQRSPHLLPAEPLIVIEPSTSRLTVNFKELWAYRELFYFLVWRDIKVRYKQTMLGVAWVVAQPLFTTVVFTLFFGILAHVPSEGIPYPVFAFAGLLPWTFFSTAVTQSGNSLIGNSNLITKVYFPRIIIPAAAIGGGLVDFAISFIVLIGLMLYYEVALSWGLLLLPFLVLLVTLFAFALGTWLSALNVKYRDVRHLLPFLLQMWMFASPVIYPPTFVPQRWRWLIILNPLTGIIDGFRAAIFPQKQFNWPELGVSCAITLLFLVYASYTFKRMEKNFADIV
jgi:lipopolysaccharide transport system permease protein